MFVGCSEIRIHVIVKHVRHAGITWAFYLGGTTEKILGCGLLGVISTQADTVCRTVKGHFRKFFFILVLSNLPLTEI